MWTSTSPTDAIVILSIFTCHLCTVRFAFLSLYCSISYLFISCHPCCLPICPIVVCSAYVLQCVSSYQSQIQNNKNQLFVMTISHTYILLQYLTHISHTYILLQNNNKTYNITTHSIYIYICYASIPTVHCMNTALIRISFLIYCKNNHYKINSYQLLHKLK